MTTWTVDAPIGDDALEYLMVFHPEILQLRRDREDAIVWRTQVMAAQVSAGCMPVLTARDLPGRIAPGCCLSCNDPLDGPNPLRCRPCIDAAWRAVAMRQRRGQLLAGLFA